MSAGKYNILIEQGATFTLNATWEIAGSPVNLTGYSATMRILRSNETIDTLTSVDSDIVLGGAAGTVAVTITDEATTAYDFNTARYVLELTSGGGVTTRLLQGAVTFDQR